MIGIFWGYQNQIFGAKQSLSAGDSTLPGFVDSTFAHVDVWETPLAVKSQYLELRSMEYQDIPRGRVVFKGVATQAKGGKYIVYLDKCLLTDAYKQVILEFFELQGKKVVWRMDAHYTTNPDDLDALFG